MVGWIQRPVKRLCVIVGPFDENGAQIKKQACTDSIRQELFLKYGEELVLLLLCHSVTALRRSLVILFMMLDENLVR